MNRRISAAGLGAVAVCAMLALAPSALATENLPTFGKCVGQSGGKFANNVCTKVKAGTNADEWEPLATAVQFTAAKEKGTANALIDESESGVEISCTGQTGGGEYGPGNQEKNVVYEFTGCKALGGECNSQGQPRGHINTKKLHGEPGVVKKEAKEEKNIDGVDLRAESGENLVEFECGPAAVLVRGGVVAKWQADSTGGTTGEETNKMYGKFEIEYVSARPGKQVPSEWTPNGEGISNSKHEIITEHPEGSANGGPFEGSAIVMTDLQTNVPSTLKLELRQCEKTIVC